MNRRGFLLSFLSGLTIESPPLRMAEDAFAGDEVFILKHRIWRQGKEIRLPREHELKPLYVE